MAMADESMTPPAPQPVRRVLVVDDEDVIRRALVRVLAINGFETRDAADGMTAWGLALSQRFDLLVTDLRMPGLDGMELATRVTQAHPSTRVLIISAYAPIGLSPYLFMPKPFSLEEFMAAVARLFAPHDG